MQIKNRILAQLFVNGQNGLNVNTFLKSNNDITYEQFISSIKTLNYEFVLTNQCMKINQFDYMFYLQIEATYLENISNQKVKEIKLSPIVMEILAIVSQNPNITRPEVNKIRGVNSDNQIKKLIENKFLRISGVNPAKANSKMLDVDVEFYKYFNISTLDELPSLDKIDINDIEISEVEFLSQKFAKEDNINIDEIKEEIENGKNS